jgi:hypothetical protein
MILLLTIWLTMKTHSAGFVMMLTSTPKTSTRLWRCRIVPVVTIRMEAPRLFFWYSRLAGFAAPVMKMSKNN